MQTAGRRQTAIDRAVRPHRPQDWARAMQELRELPPEMADRVRSNLRGWLTARTSRTACVNAVMGMILRDVVSGCSLYQLPEASEKEAQQRAEKIRKMVEEYLGRVHRHDQFVHQPGLVQESLLTAVRMDETDLERMPAELEGEARELEEVHLMYQVNNAVRRHLPVAQGDRSGSGSASKPTSRRSEALETDGSLLAWSPNDR